MCKKEAGWVRLSVMHLCYFVVLDLDCIVSIEWRGQGCLELLKRSGVAISGKRAVVLGRSNIVGMPVAHLLQVPSTPCGASVMCSAAISPEMVLLKCLLCLTRPPKGNGW